MRTQYRIEFLVMTINGDVTRSTQWFDSLDLIPAKYFDYMGEGNKLYHSAKVITRELAPSLTFKEYLAQKAAKA